MKQSRAPSAGEEGGGGGGGARDRPAAGHVASRPENNARASVRPGRKNVYRLAIIQSGERFSTTRATIYGASGRMLHACTDLTHAHTHAR